MSIARIDPAIRSSLPRSHLGGRSAFGNKRKCRAGGTLTVRLTTRRIGRLPEDNLVPMKTRYPAALEDVII